MITKHYKCTLLSDVIINHKNTSTQNNQTLDYIPGASLLGIVAKNYDDFKNPMQVFHTGDVSFSDAHPSIEGKRGMHIPAALFRPKLNTDPSLFFVHHEYKRSNDKRDGGRPYQLKQQRSGYYVLEDTPTNDAQGTMRQVKVNKTFAQKSTHDYENRRSRDAQMFGYESMSEGLVLYFDVTFSTNVLKDAIDDIEEVEKALVGKRHIGRSRSAQYGLVEISECTERYSEIESSKKRSTTVSVVADSRLCFIDENTLMPTFQPTVEQLGFNKRGEIMWADSQIRTFQYSPWNGKRQANDPDRCGIEKGSVFVVKVPENTSIPSGIARIGQYKAEGFGRIIYNPICLETLENTNGQTAYKWLTADEANSEALSTKEHTLEGTPLLHYIAKQKMYVSNMQEVMTLVNKFVKENSNRFKKGHDNFASQWGAIRRIGATCPANTIVSEIKTYINHGVAKEKWEMYNRNEIVRDLIENVDEAILPQLVVTLASEMAKEIKR